MLKQQHYTVTNIKKVKSQSTTPLILFLVPSCSAHALHLLSLSLSPDSDHQLVSSINELFSNYTLYVYRQTDIFHIAMRSVKHGCVCGCHGNVQYLLANTSYCYKNASRKYEHISPVLSTLHWLPTKHRIDFKILLITYKALNGLAPQYLSELLSHYSPSRPLRSQNSGHLIIPRISKSTAGGRSFSYLAPKLWNNLPNTVREADTLCQFKSRLKTHLFNLAYT